jgi:hypothetical protein
MFSFGSCGNWHMGLDIITEIQQSLDIHRSMEVSREEYLDYMTFHANDRPLFTEIFGPIIGLKQEWAEQGASPEELSFSAFKYRSAMDAHLPVNTGWLGGNSEKVIEETNEYIIALDKMGRKTKLIKSVATIPLPLDYPVRSFDDWKKIKHNYEFTEERFASDWESFANEHLNNGKVITVDIPGGFDEPRQLMGEEGVCVAFYEQPDLIHDMLMTICETAFKVLGRVSSKIQVDQLMVHEDMAGKSGPLAGPKQINEFIKPYYRKIWDMLRERGVRLFTQDSDGNMNNVIPAFIDAGINVMYPMEPAAEMDIVQIRQKYGTNLAFIGGLDKHVLRKSREEITQELEYKIPPMVRSGGCVFGLDHRVTNGTPLDNYRFYIRKLWEIMDREAAQLV